MVEDADGRRGTIVQLLTHGLVLVAVPGRRIIRRSASAFRPLVSDSPMLTHPAHCRRHTRRNAPCLLRRRLLSPLQLVVSVCGARDFVVR
jgi:hypothetical protein